MANSERIQYHLLFMFMCFLIERSSIMFTVSIGEMLGYQLFLSNKMSLQLWVRLMNNWNNQR